MDLKDFFGLYPEAALAFSGGTDSAFLLAAAAAYAERVKAYCVKSAFQPEFELEDAKKAARLIGADMEILRVDILSDEDVAANPPNRCYLCKKKIFSAIAEKACADGFTVLIDGTNFSDSADDRPGMKALEEMNVLSPLRLCGLTKDEIRARSKEQGLFTWNKPAYACLATRIPTGVKITAELLEKTEWAESFLFSLGFSDFRVRYSDGMAKIQIRAADLPLLNENRETIENKLKQKYTGVIFDEELRA